MVKYKLTKFDESLHAHKFKNQLFNVEGAE